MTWTGGALALLLSSASTFAMPAAPNGPQMSAAARAALVLAQADPECPEGQECPPKAEPKPAPAEEPAPAEPPAAEPEPAPAPAEESAPAEPPAAEQPPAEEPAPAEPPAAEQPAPEPAPAPAEQPAPEQQPAPEPAPAKPQQPAEQPAPEQAPAEQPAPESAPAPTEQPAPAEQSAPEQQPAPEPAPAEPQQPAEQPAPQEAPATQEQQPAEPPASTEQPAEQPAAPPAEGAPADAGSGAEQPAPNDGARAPLFDSEKSGGRRDRNRNNDGQQAAQPETPPAPPPVDDKAAQEAAQPTEIVPVTQEKGERRRERPSAEERERPAGAEIVRKLGDRIILNFNNQTFVESDDRERMRRDASDVFYEDLPRGRTREVIQRRDGSQLITVRDRNGDIVRRSRITPDGREIVLNYVDDSNFDRVSEWRDPGDDLPPMRLDIPYEDYILESERAGSPDDYYNFLSEPPVERVERLYSVDEVKRSARIRDKTRRVDLDTVTFQFGKADVPEDQVQKLEGVATAMEKMLEKNPAESFLIEGHTDAVGTDVANLALSDRRAEAVAEALTNVFGIPPENLATQGYGERYLKVRTQEPERENRRVAIRRITPLVAPVASAQ